MEKHPKLINFIKKLKTKINFNLLEEVNYWDADLCAIGFKKNNKLIYISISNYLNEKIIKYDYDLEILNEYDETNLNVIKEGRVAFENELITELKIFLGV